MPTRSEMAREVRALKKARPKKNYGLRRGYRIKTDPGVVVEFIEALTATLGRPPTTKDVVEAARPEGSPIHADFEWRDDVAAEKFRLSQARYLIAAIIVVERPENELPTHYVQRALTIQEVDSDGTNGILTREAVFSREDNLRLLVSHGRAALEQWFKKFGHMSDFASLCLPITAVLGRDQKEVMAEVAALELPPDEAAEG